MNNITLPTTESFGYISSECSKIVKECYDSCYDSRLQIAQDLSSRFEYLLPIYLSLVLFRMFIHVAIKDVDLLNSVYRHIDVALLIMTLFILCVLYIF